MKRVLLGWGGNDRVHLTAECELDCSFYGVSSQAAGTNGPSTIGVGVAGTESPGAHRYLMVRTDGGNLIFGADNGDVRFEWFCQCVSRDFGADPPRITQRNGKARSTT